MKFTTIDDEGWDAIYTQPQGVDGWGRGEARSLGPNKVLLVSLISMDSIVEWLFCQVLYFLRSREVVSSIPSSVDYLFQTV